MSPEAANRLKKLTEAALVLGLGAAAVKTVQFVRSGEEKGQIYFLPHSHGFMIERFDKACDSFIRISGQIFGFDPSTNNFDRFEIDEPHPEIEEQLPGFEQLYTPTNGSPELRE